MEPMLDKMMQIFHKCDDARSSKSRGDATDSKIDVIGKKTVAKGSKSNVKGRKSNVKQSEADNDGHADVVHISSDRSTRQSTPLIGIDPGKSL